MKTKGNKSGDRISRADLAKMAGKGWAAVDKQLHRHGVKVGKDGKVDRAKAIEAMAVGAALDKNKAQAEINSINASGNTENLVIKGKLATLRRIVLQGDLLEIERDKARGDLIPLADHKAQLLAMQNACSRIVEVWIETVGAKRRDAGLIDELRGCRDQVLAEMSAAMEAG